MQPLTNKKTERLILYKPTQRDFKALYLLWQNEKVRQFLGGTLRDKQIDQKILEINQHWKQYNFGLFAVKLTTTNDIIGICGLHNSEQQMELSYMFFPHYWGNGFATEATLACVDYGFNVLKLEKIIAMTQKANNSSCRLLEKIGMQKIVEITKFNEPQFIYELAISRENS